MTKPDNKGFIVGLLTGVFIATATSVALSIPVWDIVETNGAYRGYKEAVEANDLPSRNEIVHLAEVCEANL